MMQKKIALLLAMACVWGGISSVSVCAENSYALGDVNMNGTVDASDAALVLTAAAESGAGGENVLTAVQAVLADMTKNEIVDATDAAAILMTAAKIGAGEDAALEYVSTADAAAETTEKTATDDDIDFEWHNEDPNLGGEISWGGSH